MFSGITVLIAIQDVRTRQAIERTAQAISFRTRQISTVSQFLDEEADVLVLGTTLANGSSVICLDQWIARNRGPVCVLATAEISLEEENELITCGAWNVLQLPLRLEAMQALLYRYGTVVLDRRKIEALEQKVEGMVERQQRMTRALIGVGVLVTLLALGQSPQVVETLIPWLVKLLSH